MFHKGQVEFKALNSVAYDRVKLPFVVSSATVNYHTAKLCGMQNK